MFTSWKTSLAGIAGILTSLGALAHDVSAGQAITQIIASPEAATLFGAIGLLFAKDWNVAGVPAAK